MCCGRDEWAPFHEPCELSTDGHEAATDGLPTYGHEPPTDEPLAEPPPATPNHRIDDEGEEVDGEAAAACEAAWEMRMAPTAPTAVRRVSPTSGRPFVVCPHLAAFGSIQIYLDRPHPWQPFVQPGTFRRWLWDEDTGLWFWALD